MIQVNLVPDVKQKFLKAQRTKRIILVGSVFLSAVSIGLVVLMFMYVNVVQGRHKTNLQTDIDKYVGEIQATENVSTLLTIQKQLETLPSLHQNKPLMSRLSGYLASTVPKGLTISNFDLDFETNVITITGAGNQVRSLNVFVDSLKNATFRSDNQPEAVNAFTNIILEQLATDTQDEKITYQINGTFNPLIFTDPAKVIFNVPSVSDEVDTSSGQQPFNEQPRAIELWQNN